MTTTDINPNTAHAGMPVTVQVLSTLLFGAFGILAIIFAFNASLVGGIIVAIVIGWRGGFAPGHGGRTMQAPSVETLMSLAPEASQRSSGNASFDAYRANTLERLEQEQTSFESFLGRLRAAKDKSEFDNFLDQRARQVSDAPDDDMRDREDVS